MPAARAGTTVAVRGNAAAPTRVVAARAPRNWALYLFLILLPLQNITAGYLPNIGGGFNFLNVMFLVSLFTAMAQGGKLAPGEGVNTWVGLYAGYMLLSMLIGFHFVDDPTNHFNQLKDHLVGLFVVYVVQMSVRDWQGVRLVVLATLVPLPYIAKVVWNQHYSVASTHYSDDLRISGTFALLGANEFAAFCVTVAVVLFAMLLACRLSRFWRLMLIGGIACMVLGVLYAYSRTAYISLILGLVTVVLVWRGRLKLILPLMLAVIVLPAVLPKSVVERFDSTTVEEGKRDESTELRIEYWKIAWSNFLRNPIVGTGYHTFHHREINPYGRDTHNLYIRMLSEGGILGAIVLVGILLSVLRTAMRQVAHSRSGTWAYALALGLMGAWVSMIISNLFGDRFTYYPVVAYFWAYVALVAKSRHLPPEEMGR
ncbi:O-antigen ligase family protein [Lysobacter sp. LF1]|uniref:O-antigen ligase family protein n=1 Tax=Lysobacter stagni TaxID=3045172 RepID=A0ABT6XK21_9GAMM|nr:O-antigen ligase family protein [Lysobacter sp. LF1]MDI9240376.1 O-antigen ligase family protein [Lysobacter sp. LF1]